MTTLNNVFSVNDNQQSLLIADRNEKYFLGDRKTFMQELQDKIEKITKEMADPNQTSMIIDGETIEDKNTPGSILLISAKLNELKDLNRTIMTTFDFIKEMEKQVSQLISA